MKLYNLKLHAIDAAVFRGHTLGVWESVGFTGRSWIAHCNTCGKYAQVNARPLPNEIDIGGDALATNCTTRKG